MEFRWGDHYKLRFFALRRRVSCASQQEEWRYLEIAADRHAQLDGWEQLVAAGGVWKRRVETFPSSRRVNEPWIDRVYNN